MMRSMVRISSFGVKSHADQYGALFIPGLMVTQCYGL